MAAEQEPEKEYSVVKRVRFLKRNLTYGATRATLVG